MVIAIGDSMTFGYGVRGAAKWTAICGYTNAGINGDTTSGMLARLRTDVLDRKPDEVIIMGGANDFIMGADPGSVKANIMGMAQQCLSAGIQVILGSQIPCIPGKVPQAWACLSDFREVYRKQKELSEWYTLFAPAFSFQYVNTFQAFEGLPEEYWLSDGLHPSAEGHKLLAELLGGL